MRALALATLLAATAGCMGFQGAVQEPPVDAPPADATPEATPPPATTPVVEPTPPPPVTQSVRQLNVTVAENAFSPSDITVAPGSTVTWTNLDARRHSIVLDDGSKRAGPLAEAQQGALTFDDVGTYAYHCDIHPSMRGVVRVEALEPTPPPPPPAGSFNVTMQGRAFSPAVLRAAVGSTITWTNLDPEWHEAEANAGGLFSSPLLRQGESFTAVVSRAGTFTYRCDLHQMSGTLIME